MADVPEPRVAAALSDEPPFDDGACTWTWPVHSEHVSRLSWEIEHRLNGKRGNR